MHLRSSQSGEHEANHGQVNHRFARAGLPLVVATESTVTAEPTKGTLHHPASGQYFEDVKVGSFHDFDGAAPQFPTPVQQGARVATVGPDVFDPSASLLVEEGCEQLLGSIAVLNVGRQDHHHQQQSDCVDQNVSFASVDLFARVVAPLLADLAAFDTLTVDDARAGLGLAPLGQADVLAQVRVNRDPQSVALPESEVVVDRTPTSKVGGHIAPLTTGFQNVEDRIEQLPERMLAWPALLVGLGKALIDELPFGVRQVRCVSHPQCVTGCGTRYKLSLTKC